MSKCRSLWQVPGVAIAAILLADPALAALKYDAIPVDDGSVLLVAGEFDFDDDLAAFAAIIARTGARIVTFDSPGGSPIKAMELGRLIRSFGLSTMQGSWGHCESACALAYVGGVVRLAQTGSIGVHRSSLASPGSVGTADAVETIQQLTAETIGYLNEMGVDPSLLQLALQYEATDMRYLSQSEMLRYRVVTVPPAATGSSTRAPTASRPAMSDAPPRMTESVPQPLSGRIQHPAGAAKLRTAPDDRAPMAAGLANGAFVTIIEEGKGWYRVRRGALEAYAHASWVAVDQFSGPGYGNRVIQLKSARNLVDADAFLRSAPLPLTVYLASNGWYAITTRQIYTSKAAGLAALDAYKARRLIPADSFLTFGNTYVRAVCCQ